MNDETATTPTTQGLPAKTRSGRRRRILLMAAICFAATFALFHVVENWRGRRVWEECQRTLAAKGAILDWTHYMPPAVPDASNTFGVPEMVDWFVGRRESPLVARMQYGAHTNAQTLVVAKIQCALPGTNPPEGVQVRSWPDDREGRQAAARLISAALGPAVDDVGLPWLFLLKDPAEVKPVSLFYQCAKLPTDAEKEAWLKLLKEDLGVSNLRLVGAGSNAVNLVAPTPIRVADYVAWGDSLAPELAIIREAVSRPFARLPGEYADPVAAPIPNFVCLRVAAQRLGSMARCHLLLGQTEKALADLSLIHGLTRSLDARPTGRPMTLVAAMIHVAIEGLYVNIVRDSLKAHAWSEPQLASLQGQLEETNLRAAVSAAFQNEQVAMIRTVNNLRKANLWKLFRLSEVVNQKGHVQTGGFEGFVLSLVPEGWIDQNLAFFANIEQVMIESVDPKRSDIEPRKISALPSVLEAAVTTRSPYRLLAAIAVPNFIKAGITMARNHVLVLQGRTACALERYRLAHGEYPSALDALSPKFMSATPPDPIGGKPFRYRREDAGGFVLYSVGWNESDDGGVPSTPGNDMPELGRGDWVW